MKFHLVILAACCSLFLLPNAQANEREIQCKVVGISDGDTLTCLRDRTQLKVRLVHIDAPESAQPYGNRAKQALSTLAFKKNVTLKATGYDKYQRILAVVYDERMQNINLRLVQMGMAWAYRQTQPIYQQAQQQAQQQRMGLWADNHPINPADWRANKRVDQARALPSLQKSAPNYPLVTCHQRLSCNKIPDYATAQRYFQQCGWKELDGNGDGIPCNKLYRKSRAEAK